MAQQTQGIGVPDRADARAPIELGWVIVGHLDAPDREAVDAARARMLGELEEAFPAFAWRMPLIEREAPVTRTREQPTTLLDQGVVERQAKRWDFAFVITGADLRSFYKPFALGTPARSLSVAVMSTIRLDPTASGPSRPGEERAQVMARRLTALGMHLFGHLNDLEHRRDPTQYMFDIRTVEDLDPMERFSDGCLEELADELADVADLRLEERGDRITRSRVAFYLRTVWHNFDDVAEAVRRARPWQFPFRLSRLTAGGFAALLVLMVTEEVWNLGMTQEPWFVILLAGVIMAATCGYILERQQLLMRREGESLTELSAVSNLSMVITVFLGMVTTYAALFAICLLLALTVYSGSLVAEWAASVEGGLDPGHYLVFAGFVASLGLAIGALGASFEEQEYFRHVASVDEET